MVLCCVWCSRPNGRENMARLHIWLGLGSAVVLAHAILNCVLLGMSKAKQHQAPDELEAFMGFGFYSGVEMKIIYELRALFAIFAGFEFGVAGLIAFLSTVYFSQHKTLLIAGLAGLGVVELGIFLTYVIAGAVVAGGEVPWLRLVVAFLAVTGFAGVPLGWAIHLADTERIDSEGNRIAVDVVDDHDPEAAVFSFRRPRGRGGGRNRRGDSSDWDSEPTYYSEDNEDEEVLVTKNFRDFRH